MLNSINPDYIGVEAEILEMDILKPKLKQS